MTFKLKKFNFFFFFFINGGSRVPCDYKNQGLAVRVEESSQKPYYLAIKILFQGGQTEIVAVDVAQVNQTINNIIVLINSRHDGNN